MDWHVGHGVCGCLLVCFSDCACCVIDGFKHVFVEFSGCYGDYGGSCCDGGYRFFHFGLVSFWRRSRSSLFVL